MGLFRGAVFRHGGGARKQPIKQPTEMPTSTMALMGRFPSLMGRFLTLMGRFTDFVLRGRFPSWKSTGKQPIKKRGVKRFMMSAYGRRRSQPLLGPSFIKHAKANANRAQMQVFQERHVARHQLKGDEWHCELHRPNKKSSEIIVRKHLRRQPYFI